MKNTQGSEGSDASYFEAQEKFSSIVEKVSMKARKSMFQSFVKAASPTSQTSVLDVGVTSNRRSDSNFFERLYPHPEKLTALGIDDASFLEEEYPGLKFVMGDGLAMPFQDKAFDVATSWATIEHVGSRERQRKFVEEMVRVSRNCLITTPNRWYPIEFHTVTPLIHWLPPDVFRKILRTFGHTFYATEENLNLLSEDDFISLVPAGVTCKTFHHRLLGPVSNLVFYLSA